MGDEHRGTSDRAAVAQEEEEEEVGLPAEPSNAVYHVQDAAGIQVQKMCFEFIVKNVEQPDAQSNERSAGYALLRDLRRIKDDETRTLRINFDTLQSYDIELADIIRDQFLRFQPFLRRAVEEVLHFRFAVSDRLQHAAVASGDRNYDQKDMSSRKGDGVANAAETEGKSDAANAADNQYWVSFHNLPEVLKVRALRTSDVGKLITITGTVTRSSEVRPELLFGRFRCLECGAMSDPVEQQFRYTEPLLCTNATCSNRTRWQLDLEKSVFTDWQRVRVQENAQEIPSGSMPRCIDVILRHEMVETAKAGDKCHFTGTLIVVPDVGKMIGDRVQASQGGDSGGAGPVAPNADSAQAGNGQQQQQHHNRPQTGSGAGSGANGNMGPNDGLTGLRELGVRDLNYKLCFLCSDVEAADGRIGIMNKQRQDTDGQEDQNVEKVLDSFTTAEVAQIRSMMSDPDLYENLANSISPTTFGHELIKKGILLMMSGGVHKVTLEGINLRGDINVCIVGDPSTSKSQFLKYVASLLPRAVYTSGKASSAAGLTAAVVRDSEHGEFTIEAGALMLADNGVCCIDEFDKMDIKDQVAIHEAMEQQTISIAKAGIRATLNARASILAAANPIGGRYNPRKTLRSNLGISPAIMSRFDLFFVVQDECDEQMDYNIAQHIVMVHQRSARNMIVQPTYSPEAIKLYLKFARTITPKLSPNAKRLLVEQYRKLRENDRTGSNSYRITVRQLESMIRLSEAYARLMAESEIQDTHVREAVRLLRTSIIKIDRDPVRLDAADGTGTGRRVRNQTKANENIIRTMKNKLKLKEQNVIALESELDMYQSRILEYNDRIAFVEQRLRREEDDEDLRADIDKELGGLLQAQTECERNKSERTIALHKLQAEISENQAELYQLEMENNGSNNSNNETPVDEEPSRKRRRANASSVPGKKSTVRKTEVVLSMEQINKATFQILRIIRILWEETQDNMDGENDSDFQSTPSAYFEDIIDRYMLYHMNPSSGLEERAMQVKIAQEIVKRMIYTIHFLVDIDEGTNKELNLHELVIQPTVLATYNDKIYDD